MAEGAIHNHNDYVSEYISYSEVVEIKKAFDLFDRDLGGAIDPKGTYYMRKNSRLLSTP
jgi:Ca2+-binding EF-hand superfamily protein